MGAITRLEVGSEVGRATSCSPRGVPHFSRVSSSGAFPEAGMTAIEVLKMKTCERTTFTSAKPKTA